MSGECFPTSKMQVESSQKENFSGNADVNLTINYNNKQADTSSAQKARGKFGIDCLENQNNLTGRIAETIRQNSYAIGTDTSGGPLGTVNNIFAGITRPMQIPRVPSGIKKSNNASTPKFNKLSRDQLHGVKEVKISTKSKQLLSVRSRPKFKKGKMKDSMAASGSDLKESKKSLVKVRAEKGARNKHNPVPKLMLPAAKKISKNNAFKSRFTTRNSLRETVRSISAKRNPDLVEIYHNAAVKESKSSESDLTKKKLHKPPETLNAKEEVIPPLQIDESYKQTADTMTIPFCLTSSTSPSHNIGINIQQVMSMVKSKQTVGNLSPTLAYNIGLAAGRRDERPLPFFDSSVTSKNFYPACPLSKSTINYQQLQEVAKTIPEETIEETAENDYANSPDTQSMIITGPSGDVKITEPKQPVWTANSDEKKCTCVAEKGVGFQQIINKFNGSIKSRVTMGAPTARHSAFYFQQAPVIAAKPKNNQKPERVAPGEPITNVSRDSMLLQKKQQKLKEILKKLHDEFKKMTSSYDEVTKMYEEGRTDPNILKELETLDKEVNSKEEEIIMIVNLYEEVVALKKQIKSLKERTSTENVHVKGQQANRDDSSNNNLITAGLLNRLLHRVQHYQTHYKKP